jgi:hypothetical protein
MLWNYGMGLVATTLTPKLLSVHIPLKGISNISVVNFCYVANMNFIFYFIFEIRLYGCESDHPTFLKILSQLDHIC